MFSKLLPVNMLIKDNYDIGLVRETWILLHANKRDTGLPAIYMLISLKQ